MHYGQNDHGDGASRSADFTFGRGGENWSAAFGVEYGKDDPIYSRDRSITAFPNPGLPLAATGGPFGFFTPLSGHAVALTPGRPGTSPDDFHPYNRATDFGFNFNDYTYLQTSQERRAVFAQGRYEITPTLLLSADALFNRRQSAQRLAPPVLFFDAFDFVGLPNGFAVAADNVYNPFGEPVDLVYQRLIALGQRDYRETVDTKRLHLGLDGLFDLAGRELHWAVDISRTRSNFRSVYGPYAKNDELAQALGPSFFDASGVAHCGTATDIIADCVPLNIFAGGAAVTPQMAAYFVHFLHDKTTGQTTDYNARVSGKLLDFPAGPLEFAAGVERRLASGSNVPDPLQQTGWANGNSDGSTVAATVGSDSINEAFVEFEIPLLKDRPFARQLDLIAATRYSNYSVFGGTTNSQFGMRWKPFEDLLVRANYAQGFRAPSLFDLFSGPINGVIAAGGLVDPCAPVDDTPPDPAVAAHCRALGVPASVHQPEVIVAFTQGNNPLLQPETARSYTFGAAFSPSWLPDLDATLDWYDILLHNAIGQRDAQFFLDSCYVTGDPVSCTHVTRDADGTLKHVLAIELNLPGGFEREGIDVGLAYKRETALGLWKLRWDAAYAIYVGELGQPKRGTVLPDGSIAGGNGVGEAVNWRWRSVMTLDWERGSWSASVSSRYFSSLLEDCSHVKYIARIVGDTSLYNLCSDPSRRVDGNPAPANHVASVTYFDLEAGWEAPWKGRFILGVRNAFNRDPPPSRSQEGGGGITFISDYDVPGRFFYVNYRQRF